MDPLTSFALNLKRLPEHMRKVAQNHGFQHVTRHPAFMSATATNPRGRIAQIPRIEKH